MINRIKAARNAHRAAIEVFYEDICTIYEYQSVKDNKSGLTNKQEVPVLKDLPCRLSFKSTNAAVLVDGANEKAASVKLFISPEITIRPGSKIIVMHNGRETAFSNSGVPAVYATHQEIELKLFERWT